MRRIYLIGHGFMDSLTSFDLDVDVITYVRDGELYDGRKTEKLITNNSYSAPREVTRHHLGTRMREHYFVSDILSYQDVNQTAVWGSVNGHKARTMLPHLQGQLYNLDADRYLYFTQKNKCTRLSVLIETLSIYFRHDGDFEIHWSACRSIVMGRTHSEKLQWMNSGNLIDGIESIR